LWLKAFMPAEASTGPGPFAAAWQRYRRREHLQLVLGVLAALGWLLLPVLVLWGIGNATPAEVLAGTILFVSVIALQVAFFLTAWWCRRWRCPRCGIIWGDWLFRRVYACPNCQLAKYAAGPEHFEEESEGLRD
jgi:hypothetical protein